MTERASSGSSFLIVGGANPPRPERLLGIVREHDVIVAADAGALALREVEVIPDLVIGDFDSIGREELDRLPAERIRHDPGQDDTDLEKAIRYALAHGASRIGLAGVTGDRIDHSVNAVSLMCRYRDRAHFVLFDAGGEATLAVPPGTDIEGEAGQRVSLVPAPLACRVESEGLKYPLSGIDLGFGGRDGVSNELVGRRATVRFESGSLLVYRLVR